MDVSGAGLDSPDERPDAGEAQGADWVSSLLEIWPGKTYRIVTDAEVGSRGVGAGEIVAEFLKRLPARSQPDHPTDAPASARD